MTAPHILACSQCGQKNRIAAQRPLGQARCGSCHAALFSGTPVELGEAELARHIATDSLPLLVDVWAPWCGPCRAMAPAFAAAAAALEPEVRLFKLNADEAPRFSQQHAIRGIPALLLFRGGRVVARSAGAMDTRQIIAWTRQQLGAVQAG